MSEADVEGAPKKGAVFFGIQLRSKFWSHVLERSLGQVIGGTMSRVAAFVIVFLFFAPVLERRAQGYVANEQGALEERTDELMQRIEELTGRIEELEARKAHNP